MSPLTRLRVGLARMTLESLALCFVLWVTVTHGLVAASIVAGLLVVLRAGHILAGILGYRSLVSSVRKAAGNG